MKLSYFLQRVKEDKEKFALADRDHDSKLDETEFNACLHPQDFEHMHQYEIDRTIKDYDKNNDGLVDLGEYLGDRKYTIRYTMYEKYTNSLVVIMI